VNVRNPRAFLDQLERRWYEAAHSVRRVGEAPRRCDSNRGERQIVKSGLRRLRRLQVGSLLLFLAAAAAHAEERVRVALLPLVVHSAEGRDYLQQGLSDMLVSRLARNERLAVVPIDDPKSATDDAATARKAGVANGTDYVVYGSFTHLGEGASLELRCASVRDEKAEPRHIYVHADSMGALLPLLDGVAERATYAVLGPPPDAESPSVSTGPGTVEPTPEPTHNSLPKDVKGTDTSIGNRNGDRRAPGLPSDSEGDVVR
jgi:TolB-like protein